MVADLLHEASPITVPTRETTASLGTISQNAFSLIHQTSSHLQAVPGFRTSDLQTTCTYELPVIKAIIFKIRVKYKGS